MQWLHILAYTLLWIGGINWGLIGFFDYNLVNVILGAWPTVEQLVYILVGISTIYIIITHKTDCRVCGAK